MTKIKQILLLQIIFAFLSIGIVRAAACGETFEVYLGDEYNGICQCDDVSDQAVWMHGFYNVSTYCCGSVRGNQCFASEDPGQYTCGETLNEKTVPSGYSCGCEGGKWESYWRWQFAGVRGLCCGFTNDDYTQCLTAPPGENDVYCGDVYDANDSEKQCICGGGSGRIPITEGENAGKTCCGWLRDGECKNTDLVVNEVEVDKETLNNLNPLLIGGGDPTLSTPGGIISKALKSFIFPIAGLILFVILILGGFQMLAGANNSKSLEEGKQRITSAIIGFILLFAAYWIMQLLELIFGIRILS